MGTIKGLTIEIGGETSSLEKSLTNVNKHSKSLQGELREVERLLKLDPTNTELLAQKQKLLADSVANATEKLDKLKIAAEQAKEKLANGEIGEDQYRSLQREVIKAEQNLNGLEKQANTSGDELHKAGKKAKESGDDADKGKSGWSNLGDGIGKAGELAGKAVVALGTAAFSAAAGIGAMTVSAAENADEITTQSKQTGIATDTLQKFMYASERVDVSFETLSGSMSKLTKNMGSAKDGTGPAAEAFKTLGISITDSTGQLRDNEDVFNDAINALGQMTNETERDALAMAMFGKSAQDLNPLILGGADALKTLGEEAEAAGLILGGEQLDNLNAFKDSMDGFKATLKGSGSLFATAFAGPLADSMNTLTGYLKELAAAFNEGGFSALADKFGEILGEIINTIGENMPKIIQFGIDVIKKIIEGISQNIPALIQGAMEIMNMLVKTLLEMLPQLIEMGLQVIIQLALGIAQSLPELIPAIVDCIITIVETLIDNIDLLIDAAIAIVIALAEGIIQNLPKLIEKIPVLITKLVTAIIENIPKLLEAAVQIIVMLAKYIIENVGKLLEAGWEIIKTIGKSIADAAVRLWEIGKGIVTGIWEGIKNAGKWLWDQISGFFTGIIDGVKEFLGIHSPSTVFSGIGKFMAQGLGEGFTGSMKGIARNMQNAIPTDFEGNLAYAVTPSYAGAAAQGTSTADVVGSALLAGLSAIGDAIFEAIPKRSVFNVNGKELVTATWDDAEEVARTKGLIYAASRETLTNIARSAVKAKP